VPPGAQHRAHTLPASLGPETFQAATLSGRRLSREMERGSADRVEHRRVDGVSVGALTTRPHQRLEGGGRQPNEQARRGVPGVLDGVWHAAVEVARIADLEEDHVLTARETDPALHAQHDLFAVMEVA